MLFVPFLRERREGDEDLRARGCLFTLKAPRRIIG